MNFAAIVLAGVVIILTTSAIQTQQVPDRATECLALNMYYEARNQETAGLFAVSAVVLNRVNDPRFPNSVCEVIEQGPIRESWKTRQHKNLLASERKYYPIKNRCQFSWYCDGKSDIPQNKEKYKELLDLAEAIMYDEISFVDITGGALFYHAYYVTPGWAKTKQKTVEIQDHIFYRWDIK